MSSNGNDLAVTCNFAERRRYKCWSGVMPFGRLGIIAHGPTEQRASDRVRLTTPRKGWRGTGVHPRAPKSKPNSLLGGAGGTGTVQSEQVGAWLTATLVGVAELERHWQDAFIDSGLADTELVALRSALNQLSANVRCVRVDAARLDQPSHS